MAILKYIYPPNKTSVSKYIFKKIYLNNASSIVNSKVISGKTIVRIFINQTDIECIYYSVVQNLTYTCIRVSSEKKTLAFFAQFNKM